MAHICYLTKYRKCKDCPHYRYDELEGCLCCFAQEDGLTPEEQAISDKEEEKLLLKILIRKKFKEEKEENGNGKSMVEKK